MLAASSSAADPTGAAGRISRRPRRTLARGWRLALLLPAGGALLVGMASGLARLGVPLGFGSAAWHGLLLVLGFLGTLIALERAVAVAHPLAYVPVAASGAGAVAAITGQPTAAALLLTAAGVGLVAVYGHTLRVQPAVHLGVMAVGALAWPLTAGLWTIGWTAPQLVGPLAAFLVLTIVGERLELSRLVEPPRAVRFQLLAAIAVFVAGVVVGLWTRPAGWVLAGLGLAGQALWLARHGIAPAAFTYDAAVHAVFHGSVMSIVFGHAPIIVPAVLGVALPLHRLHYLPVVLLHATLTVRVAADLVGWSGLREAAGVGNVAALLSFLAVTVAAGRPPPALGPAPPGAKPSPGP